MDVTIAKVLLLLVTVAVAAVQSSWLEDPDYFYFPNFLDSKKIENFNLSKYAGKWHVMYTATQSQNNFTRVSVTFDETLQVHLTGTVNGKDFHEHGKVHSPADNSSSLSIVFEKDKEVPFEVLLTNYDSYSTAQGTFFDTTANITSLYALVMSRKMHMSASDIVAIDKNMNGVDWDFFKYGEWDGYCSKGSSATLSMSFLIVLASVSIVLS